MIAVAALGQRNSDPRGTQRSGELEIEADDLEELQLQRRILSRPDLLLPDDILGELAEGVRRLTVPVVITILPNGLISDVQLVRSSGVTRLDTLIRENLRNWKFQPISLNRNQTARFPFVIQVS